MEKWSCFAVVALSCCLTFCKGEGQDLAIVHKPSYVSLADKVHSVRLSDVQHILSAMHGFTLHKDLDFVGLYASSPFHHPKASVIFTLYGGSDFVKQLKEPKLNLKVDVPNAPVRSLKHKLESFYHKASNVIQIGHDSRVNDFDGMLAGMSDSAKTVHSTIADLFPSKLLNSTNPEIVHLFRQLSLILQSVDIVIENGAGLGDLYSFELYVPVSDSKAFNEELNALLNALLAKVNTKMSKLYGEDYVVLALSLPEANIAKSRKARSLLSAYGSVPLPNIVRINLATAWTADYPVIFHIILWLVVFMALLTIFVTHGMMTMDPGNDSIIYRMTTTRLKKD